MFGSDPPTRRSQHAAGAVAVAVAGALLLASPALAQQGGAQPQQDVDVSDQELRTFTEAFIDVQEIRDDLNREMEDAQNAEEAQALQEEADQRMVEVIEEEHEIGIERYNQISQAMRADSELYAQFEELREELVEEQDEEGGGHSG